jgi:predicted  nucleic acid-binding Zn-ribbon protein
MGMKEIKAEAYKRKKLRRLHVQWRKLDNTIEEMEDRIRALKRNARPLDEETDRMLKRYAEVLKSCKDKRTKLNLDIWNLNPFLSVGEENIH